MFGEKKNSATKSVHESELFQRLRGSVLAFHCSLNSLYVSPAGKQKMITFYQGTDDLTHVHWKQNILISSQKITLPPISNTVWLNKYFFVLKYKLGEFVSLPECKSPWAHTSQLKWQPSSDLPSDLFICCLLFFFFTLFVPVFKAFW